MHGLPFTAHIASLPRLLTLCSVVQGRADSSVNFSVGTDENVLHLTFYYLMNLNVMTVKAKVTTAVEMTTAISAG